MTDSQKWLVFTGLGAFGWLIYQLAPILTPFAASALLAYLGDPLADKLEVHKCSRTTAVMIVFIYMLLILVLILLWLLPMLEYQISQMLRNMPGYIDGIKQTLLPQIQTRFGIQDTLIDPDKLVATLKKHWQQAGGLATTVISSITHSGMVVIAWLANLVLIPVITFYLLRDWDIMVAYIRNELIPQHFAPTLTRLAKESDQVLGAFLRGQFTVMLALAAIYSIGLWLIDLELALLIGILAGLVSFIPYLGTIVGVTTACIAALLQFHDFWQLIPVMVVFGIGQTLEGIVLTPLLVGDRIGLHPVAVIFAVLAGGQLFGFLGILLALPVASVTMVLLRHVHNLYKGSTLYNTQNDCTNTQQE